MTLSRFFLLLSPLLFTGCFEDIVPINCDHPAGPLAPLDYDINLLGNIDGNLTISSIQMRDADTGHAMLDRWVLYTTTDGGRSWTGQSQSFNATFNAFGFLNATTGWVSLRTAGNASLLKTEDGGATYTEFVYPNISTGFSNVIVAADGDLYCRIGFSAPGAALARSTDGGESFEPIYTALGGFFSNLTITDDRLYLLDDRKLRVTTRAGELIVSHELDFMEGRTDGQLYVVDNDNLIFATSDRLFRSTDGGADWTLIHEGPAKIIGGDLENDGVLVLLSNGVCNDNFNAPEVTAFAVLKDELEIGPEMHSFDVRPVWRGKYVGNGKWLTANNPSAFYEITAP